MCIRDSTIAAWDWRNGNLTQRWFFDSDKGHQEYMGQGNHNLSVGDIDGDGKDEIVYGSSAYDDNGEPIYTQAWVMVMQCIFLIWTPIYLVLRSGRLKRPADWE